MVYTFVHDFWELEQLAYILRIILEYRGPCKVVECELLYISISADTRRRILSV